MLLAVSNIVVPGNIEAADLLRRTVPHEWGVDFERLQDRADISGSVQIKAPGGKPERLTIIVRGEFAPRDIAGIERVVAGLAKPQQPFLIATYLSARSRELLRERRINHGDTTGTVWISTDQIFVDRSGSGPFSRSSSIKGRSSLRGPLTGRIVRFLCDMSTPLKVRTIAHATAVNAGNVSRLLTLLTHEKLVERGASGAVVDVHWEALIRAWAPALKKERTAQTFLEPRGVAELTRSLEKRPIEYAITGSFAIAQLAAVAEPVAIELYVPNISDGVKALRLHASDRIGNVTLLKPFDDVVFDRMLARNSLTLAAPSQIAADALTLPHRSDEEYSALIEWMKRHEADWRG
jgi:hypothetical protein